MRAYPFGLGVALYALLGASSAAAQSTTDGARCEAALTAPTKDSVTSTYGIRAKLFDSTRKLPPNTLRLLAEGAQQFFHVVPPLALATYAPSEPKKGESPTAAEFVISGAYAADLYRDGHLGRIRGIGGTHDQAIDRAMVGALGELSASQLIPPIDRERSDFPGESVDVRFTIRSISNDRPADPASTAPNLSVPVLRLRMPAYRITKTVAPQPRNVPPRYPEIARKANVEGKAVLSFVVTAEGRIDMSSIQVVEATAAEFVPTTLEALPGLKFFPMIVEGCAVRTFVSMPFQFSLTR